MGLAQLGINVTDATEELKTQTSGIKTNQCRMSLNFPARSEELLHAETAEEFPSPLPQQNYKWKMGK